MTATPAARLREAAGVVRKMAAAVSTPDPADMPFHADGTDVTQGQHGLYDVATTQTPELAAWIALLHPGVGEALAAWLESVADLHEPNLPGCRGIVTPGCQWCGDEDWPCADTRHALALADAILAAVTR